MEDLLLKPIISSNSLPPLSHRVLHDLSPVSDQHQPEGGAEHDHQERPVELSCRENISVKRYCQPPPLTIQSPRDGVESKHDEDDHVGNEVCQHLEPEECVDLLTSVVKVTVDSSQDIQLDHHCGFLISRYFSLIALQFSFTVL